uniref:Uncharacterized protein n=2 Tax=Aegilops tauschii subsp. strangulata TaxID=200361 RepID=A0A453I3I5_AEGTS
MPPHLPCWSSRLLVEVSHCHRCRCLGPSSRSCRGRMFVEASRHAEVSTMRKRRSVADIESSSNGEVAVLEELEDAIFQF